MYPTSSRGSNDEDPYSWMKPKKKTLFGDPSTYSAAVNQQGSDYDSIMKLYDDFINKSKSGSMSSNPLTSNPVSSSPIGPSKPLQSGNPLVSGGSILNRPVSSGNPLSSPQPITSNAISRPGAINFDPIKAKTSKYEQSDDVTKSLSNLGELSRTGGYSATGIQDIRERNLSPIRSIYASGKQGLERQRALSGGYSPNFNAVSASMARDQATKIGDITTRTNADIAQNVASNRIAAASPYASASSNANSAKTAADQRNADIVNQINELNLRMKGDIDKFNTSTGLDVDRYNRDTQLGVDRDNRDTRLGIDRENRNTKLFTDKYNEDNRLNTEGKNREFQFGVDKTNRDTQRDTNRDNRDFETSVNRDNRDTKMSLDKYNEENRLRVEAANNGMKESEINRILEAIRGKTSLYGTTPALANMFGNQVGQANQIGQNQQEINNRRRQSIISGGVRG